MTELLVTRLRTPRRAGTQAIYEEAVNVVIAQMRRCLESPLNLADMASLAGVSRSHFDRVFRNVTGLTPRQFQTAVRLRAATRLLLTTSTPVTDVCFDVGYESLGTFITKFTETFGVPPQKLRAIAERLSVPWSEWMKEQLIARFAHDCSEPSLRGRITAREELDGVVFAGLFASPIPQNAPLGCTVTRGIGPYAITGVPDGEYYALAIGVPWHDRPIDFLISECALRGGNVHGPVVIRSGSATADVTIALRAPAATDPPINFALPFVLMKTLLGRE